MPTGPPADGHDGAFYGVTAGGGTSNLGTVYKLSYDGARFATLKSFTGADATTPYTGLVVATNGTLFGTTYSGGISNFGTLFKLNRDGTGFQLLHQFTGGADGQNPSAALMEGNDGAMYGATYSGNSATRGTIVKINKDGTNYRIVHSFTGNPDGQNPSGRLVQDSSGVLYGTTVYGGSATVPGVVFAMNNDGSSYGLLHIFGGAGDGRNPQTGVTLASDGWLYGTAAYGGSAGYGVVFKMFRDGNGYTVLYSFLGTGNDGQRPNSELVEGVDGSLYGATYQGGVNGVGIVFKMAKDGSGYTAIHQFGSAGGDLNSASGLLAETNGYIYGTAQYGGGLGAGGVYALSPAPLAPRILSQSISAGSNSLLCATTTAIQYDLQRSADLSSWSTLATATAPANGQLVCSDTNIPVAHAYYRLHQH